MPSQVSTLSKNLLLLSTKESRALRSFPRDSCNLFIGPIKPTKANDSSSVRNVDDRSRNVESRGIASTPSKFSSALKLNACQWPVSRAFSSGNDDIVKKEKKIEVLFGRLVKIWKDLLAMANFTNAILAFFLLISLFTASDAAASTPEEAFVKKTVSEHDIVIFSKSYCPYCRRAKAVFKEFNKVPHVIELDERDDGMDIQDALSRIVGRRTVPQVFIKGKHLGGSDDTVEAYEDGTLSKLLGSTSEDEL